MKTLALALIIPGVVLFAAGDLIWLVRNTFSRPLPMRTAGALIILGIAFIGAGLVSAAFS